MPYSHLFSSLAGHIQSWVAAGGYPFLFLTILLEGIPLVGTAIPGHITIVAAGFLARIGVLNIYWVLFLGIAGAIGGDFIGFLLGRRYGMSLIDRLRPYFFITEAHIEKARRLIDAHTGKTMIIGRFSPITRPLMPFLVGASRTPAVKFWIFNTIGGASWAAVSILAGYAFGASYHFIAGYLGKFMLLAAIAAVLILWGYRFVNMRFHIFRRYDLFILALNLVSLWALARTIQDAWSAHSFMANFDVWVNVYMAAHVTQFIASLASWTSYIGGFSVVEGLTVLIGLTFALHKRWRSSAIMLVSVGGTFLAFNTMKEFFLRARPENALALAADPSFPSGHAAMAAAFFLGLAYVASPHIRSWVKRELFLASCVLAAIAIGLSRVALNVHWASDVIAGWALGAFIVSGSILLVRYAGTLIAGKVSS